MNNENENQNENQNDNDKPDGSKPNEIGNPSTFDTDVLIIGSGFGGSVAALRFSEAGHRVVVLERGAWLHRDNSEVDLDALWNPKRHRFGVNDLQSRGRHIVPWLGSGVGGGSHVYAGTMKLCEDFNRFPSPITCEDMEVHYAKAAEIIEPMPYPDYAPYSKVRATEFLYEVGAKLKKSDPNIVESHGPINLAISFAPQGETPGAEFVNKHGATQRYSDPREQSLLGGDISCKNTLDLNYLHLAQKHGAKIRALSEADKIESLDSGGWKVNYTKYIPAKSGWKRFQQKWLRAKGQTESNTIRARRVIVAAGCIGSTELLLRNRDVHQTLPALSSKLGESYTTNGDFISLLFPYRGLFIAWAGLIAAIVGLIGSWYWLAAAGGIGYLIGLLLSRRPFDPDIGTTNSDYIKFRARDGSSQGAYIESGRYPTPVRLSLAVILSGLGMWRPHYYGRIVKLTNVLRRFVPPFALLARTWPLPLLKMGRDDAFGTFSLDGDGRAIIDYDLTTNGPFYDYLNELGRKVARAGGAWWAPNFMFKVTQKLEVPHNQGGAPMGDNAEDGVVDHAGRVFGYDDLMVLDGSIIPVSPGPNPAFTILALAERGMEIVLEQLERGEPISAQTIHRHKSNASQSRQDESVSTL